MRNWILIAALAIIATSPAQAHSAQRHHRHVAAKPLPDSVILGGKAYKVCKPGMEDDCVQSSQAGLGRGRQATPSHHRRTAVRHR